jgi:UDP-2,3-diacylglucosamine hydrolase
VYIVVGDIHFGKGEPESEREKERSLVSCLRSVADEVEELILLGDVFDYFIEYRHLMPKGYVRFLGLLAHLADAGVRIRYFAGNHDPWHQDFFETEFGAEVHMNQALVDIYGNRTYLHHGDGIARKSATYNRIRDILRHPLPVWMYKTVIPGDAGAGLARYVSRRFGEEEVDYSVAADLRTYAEALLENPEIDQVVLGHTHVPEVRRFGSGLYCNPGAWHETQTLLRLSTEGGTILKWNGSSLHAYDHRSN